MSGLWYVKLADGDVEPLTLDELDEAFQAGHVNEHTMVLPAGSTQWAKLGELAGLDQPQRPAAHVPTRAVAPLAPMPNSLRPVSVDLGQFGGDDDDFSFQPPKKSKKWMFGVALVAGVMGFAAFEAQRAGVVSISRLMSSSSQASAVAVATPTPTVAPAPAPSPDPAPAVTAAPAASTDTSATSRFTQDQKDKLAAADKQKTKLHPKTHAAASAVHGSASRSKGQGFTTGGNKYDPLNATIP